MVGRHGDYFFAGDVTGLLGQFRHQYFLLFLIAHFHKAALLSMSDELAVAMNRLPVERESIGAAVQAHHPPDDGSVPALHAPLLVPRDVEPDARPQRATHGSPTSLAPRRMYEEVRKEVTDMNEYLDSDSAGARPTRF